jgi:hypothetical protein
LEINQNNILDKPYKILFWLKALWEHYWSCTEKAGGCAVVSAINC